MYKTTIDDVTIEIVRGDIADQPDMDAIVNAANAQLQTGGGVAGAIHRAAGPGLAEEGRRYAPIRPGEAVMTGAHGLPNRCVIHCLGPVYGRDEPSDELLASCYREAISLADEKSVASIAFPALSTGAFGFPAEPAARIALGTVLQALPPRSAVKHVRFVLFSDADAALYEETLRSLQGERRR